MSGSDNTNQGCLLFRYLFLSANTLCAAQINNFFDISSTKHSKLPDVVRMQSLAANERD